MIQGSQGSTVFEDDDDSACIMTSIERFNLREGHFKEDGSCLLEFDASPPTPEPQEQNSAPSSPALTVQALACGVRSSRACAGSWRVAEAAMTYHITATVREVEDPEVMAWRVQMRRFKAPTLDMVLAAKETQQRFMEEQQRVFEQEQLRVEMYRAAEEAAQQIVRERARAAEEQERLAMAAEEEARLAMVKRRQLQEAQQRYIEQQQRAVEDERRRVAMEQRRAFEIEQRRLARERQVAMERHLAMMQQRAAEEAAERLAREEATLLAEATQVHDVKRKKPRGCRSGKLVRSRREYWAAHQDGDEANQG